MASFKDYNQWVQPELGARKADARQTPAHLEAMRLFRERGFGETTVADIAEAAGVSRGTFFNYYPYKEAILLEHAAIRLENLGGRVAAEMARGTSPTSILYAISDDLARFVESNRSLILPLAYF